MHRNLEPIGTGVTEQSRPHDDGLTPLADGRNHHKRRSLAVFQKTAPSLRVAISDGVTLNQPQEGPSTPLYYVGEVTETLEKMSTPKASHPLSRFHKMRTTIGHLWGISAACYGGRKGTWRFGPQPHPSSPVMGFHTIFPHFSFLICERRRDTYL